MVIKLRPEVRWFAEQMELKLRENDWKGGWQAEQYIALFRRLEGETKELNELMVTNWDGQQDLVVQESADIANFAMMIADNASKGRRSAPKNFHPTHGE